MGFLRTLFWIAITVVVVVFSLRNWQPVTINLFGNLQADVKLPLLLLIAFLLGFLPIYVWHRATGWRRARKVAVERAPAMVPAEAVPGTVPGEPTPFVPTMPTRVE